jgi:eukaryotic-like serine/threonine-protein kinase
VRDPLDLIDSTVGDEYAVVDVVNRGELSVIYRVRSIATGEFLALKCYIGLANLPEPSRSIFRSNIKHIGRLIGTLAACYPGHVRVVRTGSVRVRSSTDVPAMLLEWLDGTTLASLLARERETGLVTRDAAQTLDLMREPLAGLAAAHDYGIVHRNIEPGNVFVCGERLEPGVPIKLLDFSLAKLSDGEADPPAAFTPRYAAPEQFWGDESSIGPWTDVYGLALIFVELMLGGRFALRGSDIIELQAASEDPGERPTPRAHGLEVPNAIESVFRRALAVEPRDRFPHAGEFLYALERGLACDGRLTSTQISRVSGVLEYHPTEDTAQRRPFHTPSRGTLIAPPPETQTDAAEAGTTGDTVVSPVPRVQTGFTVLAPIPDFDRVRRD